MLSRIFKYTLLLVLLLSCVFGQAQDKYLRKYYNFSDLSESPRNYTKIDDKSYIWGTYIEDGVTNTYLIISNSEDQQQEIYQYANARMGSTGTYLFDEEKNKFVVPVMFVNEDGEFGEQIMEVDIDGNEIGRFEYEFHESDVVWEEPFSIVKYKNGYAIAGMVYYNNDQIWSRGGISFLDINYNKVKSYRTNSTYHVLENLMLDNEGTLWGIIRNWNFTGPDDGFQKLVSLDKELFITATFDFYGDMEPQTGDDALFAFHEELNAFVFNYDSQWDDVVIGAIDREGVLLWRKVGFKPHLDNEQQQLTVLSNGDILIAGNESYPSDINDNFCFNISRFESTGEHKWTRFYYHYRDDMEIYDFELTSSRLFPRAVHESEHGELYILLGELEGLGKTTPMIVRVDSTGLIGGGHDGIRQYIGKEHPPENLNSPRAIWHIFNEDTGEMYRYSFDEIWDGGLRLLRSDEMTGENWYETNKIMSGGLDKVIIKSFKDGLLEWSPHNNYDFRLEEGEFLDLRYNSPISNERAELLVEEVDEVTLLDGRVWKRQRLRCKADTDGTEYGYRTWIQGIGDIDNFSFIKDVCRERQSEKILCYYAVGELMYVHPDYEGCITDVEELQEASRVTISPNPTSSQLSFSERLTRVMVYDMMGRVVLSEQEKYGISDLDVSMLNLGMYLIHAERSDGYKFTSKFIKVE